MELGIFLTHKVIPCTFPSLLKVALGKQGIHLLLYIGIIRNFSLKNSKALFWYSLPIFISLHGYFAGKTYIFCLCTRRLNQTHGSIVTSMLSIVFTHIWPQNVLLSLNTVLSKVIFESFQNKSLNHLIKVLLLKTCERTKVSRLKMFQKFQCPKLRS